jgi:hypothetical protein
MQLQKKRGIKSENVGSYEIGPHMRYGAFSAMVKPQDKPQYVLMLAELNLLLMFKEYSDKTLFFFRTGRKGSHFPTRLCMVTF